MTIDRQTRKISQVKRSQSAVIENPLRLPLGTGLRQVKIFTRKNNITGILIETEAGSGVLAGLLTRRDMPWSDDVIEEPLIIL